MAGLDGRVALVTGASSGIGRATARALAAAGAQVAVNHLPRSAKAGEEVVAEIAAAGADAVAVAGDVSVEVDVEAMVAATVERFGTLHVLVNNAGIQRDAPFVEMSLDEWRAVIEVNLTGQFLCARAAAREFLRRGIDPEVKLEAQDPRHARLLDALVRDLAMVGAVDRPDVVHCHTWYAHLAGCLARPRTGARLVLTTHSLEPHRPWKVEQLGSAYHATTWIELNQPLFSALKLEKRAMFIILVLIVLVAAFNIISTLTMIVTDKTKEIGILRSMGMQGRAIRRIFVYQGALIGVVGTGLGTVVGLIAALLLARYRFISLPGDVYFIDTLPVSIEPLSIAMIAGASLLISLAATIYPSRQAARMTPVDAIRYE